MPRTLVFVVVSVASVASMASVGWSAETPASSARPPAETRVVVAGPRYKAGTLHRVVLGSGYRTLWTAPVEVEVLDLPAFSGGLVPTEKGGGKQTKGLKFKSGDGRKWKFRSVDKDPSPVLPKALRRGFVRPIVQDKISASLPAGCLVVDPLTEAAGILHVKRQLVVLPDDPRLGEFRTEFAGMLGTIEEAPSVEAPVTAGFADFTKLVDADELDELLDADPAERVDSRAFLRARLLDVLIGDYDRHRDQWEWARSRKTDRWLPVPRDRDMAFVNFNGLVMKMARPEMPRLVDFEDEYANLVGLTWQARFLDRRYLAELDWPAWQQVLSELQGRLSDAVVDDAVRRLPAAYYDQEGAALAERLKLRRQRLAAFARRYYELLARDVEIHGTDETDVVQLARLGDGSVEVVATGSKGPYLRRTFRASETNEVRVYLKDGDDRVASEGVGGSGVVVRVVGGDGNDVLDDSGGGHTRFYDSSGKNRVIEGTDTETSDRSYVAPEGHDGQPLRDWGTWTRYLPSVRAGGGYGLLLGASVQRTGYGFRTHPFADQHSLRVAYSTARTTSDIEYQYQSLRSDGRRRLKVNAAVSSLNVIRFYGFGNETTEADGSGVHDVNQRQYVFTSVYGFDLPLDVSLGPIVKYAQTHLEDSSLLAVQQPYGVGGYGQVGGRLGVGLGRRDDRMVHPKSAWLSAQGTFYPSLWSVTDSFGGVRFEAATVITAALPLSPALAVRAGGEKIFGRYPFHEAATIGGGEGVRGFASQRYAGDATLYGNAEIRLLLRSKDERPIRRFGVFGLVDTGRVYLEGEASDRWHTAVGGGVWLSVVEPAYTLSLAAARSDSRLRLYVQGGFGF